MRAQLLHMVHSPSDAFSNIRVRREDLGRAAHRTGLLDPVQPCARCARPLSQPPPAAAGPSGGALPKLYLFPTGNAFHAACLCTEVLALAPPQQAERIRSAMQTLSKVSASKTPRTKLAHQYRHPAKGSAYHTHAGVAGLPYVLAGVRRVCTIK